MTQTTPNHTLTVSGWAAHDPSAKITPYTFKRRENGVNDITIKILYCGICHTDLHHAKNDWGITMYPVVPGHEIIGVITKVGSDVKGFSEGERVGVGCLAATCLDCEYCKTDQENYCEKLQFVYNGIFWDGSITYGGYSEMLVVDYRYVVHIPENLAMDAAAPLLCAGITVFSPLKDHDLVASPGKKIGVVGLGGLGHLAVKFGKAFGHHVTVISTSPSKEAEARQRLGADDFIVSTNPTQLQDARKSLDFILDTVSAQHSLLTILELLKINGTLFIVGAPDKPFELPAFPLIFGKRSVKGGIIGGIKETQEMLNICGKYRGAKALREINSSSYAKQVFDLMRKQEQTRLAELDAEKVHYELIQSQGDIERQRKMAEEQRNLIQEQAQRQAQVLRYEDELARKRMQADHEAQRRHNVELVKMQEESSVRKEHARQATEEQIQSQQRQTERERAEIERETIRVKAMAEAEGRAHEAKLTEDHNRRMLIERMQGERDKWLAAINTAFSHIEGGIRVLLTDRDKLLMTVGGATALAAGVYTTREGAKVTWGYINRILGQPSLIRESSMAKFPGSKIISQAKNKVLNYSTSARAEKPVGSQNALGNVILHPSLQRRIEHLARATSNTKAHQAPFRNMLFYGPPGTGKTMVAREIAQKSGLDYAMMTGGDVAPLGPQAVTKIHEIFDWAKKSRKGLLLFIDEADAFLCERNSTHMSEAQRSALNALLFRTGDQSRDIVLVLATNRPGDLDSAITDRIDEVIEFPLPGEEERLKLLKLYLNKYLCDDNNGSKGGFLLKKQPQKITIKDLSEDVFREAAKKTEGFSGREIAKLMASVQAAVYGRPDCILDSELFKEIVDYKVMEHHQRLKLAAEGGLPDQVQFV